MGGQTRLSLRSRFLGDIEPGLFETENLADETVEWESEARPGMKRRFPRRVGGISPAGVKDDEDSADVQRAIRKEIEAMEDRGPGSDLDVGESVSHPTFGVGKVVAIRGAGGGAKVTVDFPGIGRSVVLRGSEWLGRP